MSLRLKIGLDAVNSYRRLAYTPWHAIAEFVDNSTQSYFNNKDELDKQYKKDKETLEVRIIYDRKDKGLLRVVDNAMGMSYEELESALHIGLPPTNTQGRSKYGMGLKTSASWVGNLWSVRTKKYGETVEHYVEINIDEISHGESDTLPYKKREGLPKDEHYTVIEIKDHNRIFHGRTLSKIKQYLCSMYREDFRNNVLKLYWQHELLQWEDFELLKDREGNLYKKHFSFTVRNKDVSGWVGILESGTRLNAGFSIIHCGRVVRGWPEAWRPSSLYGQLQGSNDLVNQRLVGEIHLDAFDVSHTKDDILWFGDEEELVEKELLEHCGDYRQEAKIPKKHRDDERGPSAGEIDVAVDEFRKELTSPEMLDKINLEDSVPEEEIVHESITRLMEHVKNKATTFEASFNGLRVKGYLDSDVSISDPYVAIDSASSDEVIIIVNLNHPHWMQLKGSDGVLNYIRHCTYDAISEWKARRKVGRVDPETIKLLKDQLLRVPFEIEMHEPE